MAVLNHPFLIVLLAVALISFVIIVFVRQKIVNITFKIIFSFIVTTFVIFSLLLGATYQEILVFILIFLVAFLFFFFGFKHQGVKKEDEKK